MATLGHGEREGPAGDKLFAQQMTQDTVGGYGVERSGTEPPGDLLPAAANVISTRNYIPLNNSSTVSTLEKISGR